MATIVACHVKSGQALLYFFFYPPAADFFIQYPGKMPHTCATLKSHVPCSQGRVDFPPAMEVAVRVIDSAGKPLEGISVQHRSDRGNYWGQQAVTDGEGAVHLYVPQHCSGPFVVEYFDDEAMSRVREGVPYTVGGAEDAEREFVLPLSEAFLERLRRSRPGV